MQHRRHLYNALLFGVFLQYPGVSSIGSVMINDSIESYEGMLFSPCVYYISSVPPTFIGVLLVRLI